MLSSVVREVFLVPDCPRPNWTGGEVFPETLIGFVFTAELRPEQSDKQSESKSWVLLDLNRLKDSGIYCNGSPSILL